MEVFPGWHVPLVFLFTYMYRTRRPVFFLSFFSYMRCENFLPSSERVQDSAFMEEDVYYDICPLGNLLDIGVLGSDKALN